MTTPYENQVAALDAESRDITAAREGAQHELARDSLALRRDPKSKPLKAKVDQLVAEIATYDAQLAGVELARKALADEYAVACAQAKADTLDNAKLAIKSHAEAQRKAAEAIDAALVALGKALGDHAEAGTALKTSILAAGPLIGATVEMQVIPAQGASRHDGAIVGGLYHALLDARARGCPILGHVTFPGYTDTQGCSATRATQLAHDRVLAAVNRWELSC